MSPPSSTVGVIGLGLLGTAIAERLLAQPFAVVGQDVDATRGAGLESLGGTAAASAHDVCQRCACIILSLPTSNIVAAVLADLPADAVQGRIFVDTTTGDPEQMIAIGKSLAEGGASYLEANVAGSSAQVRAGTAAVFLGGEASVVQAVEPLLSAMASQRFYLGPVGAASKFKLVHNLVLGLHRAVLAEGLYLAEALGFSPAEALRILQETPAASRVMESKGTKMATRTYDVQARLSQHLKDVRLILEAARRAGKKLPLSEQHLQLLQRAESGGFGGADNSAVLEAFYAADAAPPRDAQSRDAQ